MDFDKSVTFGKQCATANQVIPQQNEKLEIIFCFETMELVIQTKKCNLWCKIGKNHSFFVAKICIF